MSTNERPRVYLNPYIGGTLLGIVLFLTFFVTGGGLGASGGINHVQVALLKLAAPAHIDRVAYMADIGGGVRNALNNSGVFMLLGTILGGALSGLWNRRMKVEIRKGPRIAVNRRLAFAFAGGTIMGFGARLARGCTSGQALSGGAVLSVGSFAFMFSVFGGAYALAWFLRRIWN